MSTGAFTATFVYNVPMYGETIEIQHRFANVFRAVLELEQFGWQNACEVIRCLAATQEQTWLLSQLLNCARIA